MFSSVGPVCGAFGQLVGTVHDGTCYLVFDEKKSWHDAKTRCEDIGGQLAIINDDATTGAIVADLPATITENNAWIGMKTTDPGKVE